MAQDKKTPVSASFRFGAHDSFDRLAIDLARDNRYTLSRADHRVTLVLQGMRDLSLPKMVLSPKARIINLKRVDAEGEAIQLTFDVAADAVIKDYRSGNVLVIDVLGKAASVLPTPTQTMISAPSPSPSPIPSPTPAPVVSEAVRETAPILAESKKTEQNAPVSAPSIPVEKTVLIETPTASPLAEGEKKLVKTQTAPAAKEAVISVAPNAVLENKAGSELVAAFDAKSPLGVVVFARGGFVTVLFDRKIRIDPKTLFSAAPLKVRLLPFELAKNSGFRFEIPLGADVMMAKEGYVWKIFFSRSLGDPSVVTNIIAQPEFALGARLLFPTVEAPDPVLYTDPVVGDTLFLVPLSEHFSFPSARHMADVELLSAAQGLVVNPLHERVVVRKVADGLEITAEGGLKLSPSMDTGIEAKDGRVKPTKFLFDLKTWRGASHQSFTQKIQRLMQNVIEAQPRDRLLNRLELARFYFSYGMGEETLALLRLLEKQEPDIINHPDYVGLRGAARILTRQIAEGMQDLSMPRIADLRETDLWRAVGYAQMRDWPRAYDRFNQVQNLLKTYPQPFYAQFMLLAIEAALAEGKDSVAASWIEAMEKTIPESELPSALFYLKGALASKEGTAEKAALFWKNAAKGSDRLYKIRAELALIDLSVATGSMTPTQAAARLEGLRFSWRGDDLELDILFRLGSFYLDAKNYRAGLNVLGHALRLFPTAPMSPTIKNQMTDAYRDLFLGHAADTLSPIEAFSLYQDFSYLKTKEDGYKIGRKLVETLVAIDLLDAAAQILETQMKNGLPPEERGVTGTRLAAIYLLDHKAEKALGALTSLQASDLTPPLFQEVTLLRARALMEQKKFPEALALLENNDSSPALMLRADILMRAEKWDDAAIALLRLAPVSEGDSLNSTQAEILVNAAIAFSLAGKPAELDRLAQKFGAAMARTSYQDMFRILTRPDKMMQASDLRAAAAQIADVDLFRKVLDSYRQAPTPTATPAPSPAPAAP